MLCVVYENSRVCFSLDDPPHEVVEIVNENI